MDRTRQWSLRAFWTASTLAGGLYAGCKTVPKSHPATIIVSPAATLQPSSPTDPLEQSTASPSPIPISPHPTPSGVQPGALTASILSEDCPRLVIDE
jgi:hypothetical protein